MTESEPKQDRPVIAVVYHSGTGNTAEMSRAVVRGVEADGNVNVVEHEIVETDFNGGRWLNEELLAQLDESDAIIMGSPTYMGSVSSQLKAFMDATSPRYLERKWVDKIGAAFTVSGSPSGDKMNMLMTCATFAMQHGMIWVGVAESPVTGEGHNRLGFFFGAGGLALFEPPTKEDQHTGELLGRRVAALAVRMQSKDRSS